MPDTSTPSPSDPDPSGKESASIPEAGKKLSGKEKPRLKLKRLVVKDTKINPHINPDAEPIPHAEPISEPEPEPEPVAVPESVSDETTPAEPREPAPPQKLKIKSSEPEEPREPETEQQDKAETQPESNAEPTAAQKQSSAESKPKKKKKLLFPLLLIFGSLAYGVHVIFDPLGLKPEPIAPVDVPIRTAVEPPETSPEAPTASLEISKNLQDITHIDMRAYLDKLARQELQISTTPRGIYINGVFYAEDMPLNPALGLVVQSISAESTPPSFTVSDSDGNTYPIQLP